MAWFGRKKREAEREEALTDGKTAALAAARQAAEAGDDAEAARQYETAAELGDANAMFLTAVEYARGGNLNKDLKQALFWAEKAEASTALDPVHDAEELVRVIRRSMAFEAALAARHIGDDAEAVRQYELAAEKGSGAAAYNLSLMYRDGDGAPQNATLSLRFREMAGELGYSKVYPTLLSNYCFGQDGAEQDWEKALYWGEKALDAGYDVDAALRVIRKQILRRQP